jgi:hypothetical protein
LSVTVIYSIQDDKKITSPDSTYSTYEKFRKVLHIGLISNIFVDLIPLAFGFPYLVVGKVQLLQLRVASKIT